MENYNVVLLLGDILNDFSDVFRQKSSDEGLVQVDSLMKEWGKKFIVLSNDIYGEWENALYNYKINWSDMEKDSLLFRLLQSY